MMLKTKTMQQKGNTRKSTTLPAETVEYLKNWMMSPEHIDHPYPTEREKAQIMADTGIGIKPLTNWFVNNRKRYWKPRYEARLQQQKAEAAKARGTTAAPPAKVPVATSVVITSSPTPKSPPARQYLGSSGRRVSIGGSGRNVLQTPILSSPSSSYADNPARAVSIGSASSLSSELSDGNSFDDDDSVAFASPRGRKVEIILDLKRSRCVTLDSSDDEEDCYEGRAKRCRLAKKVTVQQIPHHGSPRSEYVGKDTTQWRSVCGNAGSGFEHALPTLEEAALMFGHNQ